MRGSMFVNGRNGNYPKKNMCSKDEIFMPRLEQQPNHVVCGKRPLYLGCFCELGYLMGRFKLMEAH